MLFLLCLTASAARASLMARIERGVATGTASKPAFVIDLYRGVGFDISLLASGEKIADWWVDDPSRVIARTDRTLQILSLRLVNLPAVLPSNRNWTTLKLLAQDSQGRMSLLHFVVRFQERTLRAEELRFHGVEVLPETSSSGRPTLLR